MPEGPKEVAILNNGAEIKRAQELEENKRLLAAQREMYCKAKRLDAINAVVCFGVPLCATVAQLFLPVPPGLLFSVWLLSIASGLFLPHVSAQLVEMAAQTQQAFDSKVFGIRFENMGYDSREISRYAERYYARCRRKGEDPGLGDWYSVSLSGLKAGEAISRCQRQNVEWTRRLLRRSIRIEVCAAVVFGAALVLSIAGFGADPMSLMFLTSIIEWAVQRIVRCRAALQRVRDLSMAMSAYKLVSLENIRRAQKYIFAYRKSSYLVPDFLYGVFKDSDDAETCRD